MGIYIYGSIAQEKEQAHSDVDLMVIGSASTADLVPILKRLEQSFQREINVTRYSEKEFKQKLQNKDHFLLSVLKKKVADALAKWLPPNGFTGKVHHLDAKVGGSYKMSFTNFTTGKSHSFGGTYHELTPDERIRYTDKIDDPNLPGEMQTTIALKQVFCGTEMNITQEGVPAAIPAEACYLGWQESLTLLAQLVEAEIPDRP